MTSLSRIISIPFRHINHTRPCISIFQHLLLLTPFSLSVYGLFDTEFSLRLSKFSIVVRPPTWRSVPCELNLEPSGYFGCLLMRPLLAAIGFEPHASVDFPMRFQWSVTRLQRVIAHHSTYTSEILLDTRVVNPSALQSYLELDSRSSAPLWCSFDLVARNRCFDEVAIFFFCFLSKSRG